VILCDVNILLRALREISPDDSTYHAWLTAQTNSDRPGTPERAESLQTPKKTSTSE